MTNEEATVLWLNVGPSGTTSTASMCLNMLEMLEMKIFPSTFPSVDILMLVIVLSKVGPKYQ